MRLLRADTKIENAIEATAEMVPTVASAKARRTSSDDIVVVPRSGTRSRRFRRCCQWAAMRVILILVLPNIVKLN